MRGHSTITWITCRRTTKIMGGRAEADDGVVTSGGLAMKVTPRVTRNIGTEIPMSIVVGRKGMVTAIVDGRQEIGIDTGTRPRRRR